MLLHSGFGVSHRGHLRAVAGLAFLIACTVGLPAAAPAAEPGLKLSGAYFRMIIPQRPAAGYFTLQNNTAVDKVLTGALSPACTSLMLHRSMNSGGMDMMMHVDSVPLPAHGSVSFDPGGYHMMCMQPKMKPGDSVPVTLKFQDGATLQAEFPVHGARGQ